ncbi:hypothetical protein L484_021623 [Morus notabilis]|uniref:Uncharacterized protein n=1 Tax=Morus notabilis TaxID=981085 RepID=W9RXT5_9ROSA|nr:hypothetical protein L484_021623 [Morus notabilis]
MSLDDALELSVSSGIVGVSPGVPGVSPPVPSLPKAGVVVVGVVEVGLFVDAVVGVLPPAVL